MTSEQVFSNILLSLHQKILIHVPFLYFIGSYIYVIHKLNKETEDLDGDIEDLVQDDQDLVDEIKDDQNGDHQNIGDEIHRGIWGSR